MLRSKFAHAIERMGEARRILFHGVVGLHAVNTHCAGVNHAGASGFKRELEKMKGGFGVGAQIINRVIKAYFAAALPRNMQNSVILAQGQLFVECGILAVGLKKFCALRDIFGISGGQVVHPHHLMPSRNKPGGNRRPDKTANSSHQIISHNHTSKRFKPHLFCGPDK